MTGIQTIEAARMAIFHDPQLGDIPEDLGFTQRTCANCRSYSLYFRDQMRHCHTAGRTVVFGTEACKAQRKRERPQSFDLALHKLSYYRTEFSRLEDRLGRVRDRPLQMLAPHRRQLDGLASALQKQKQVLDVDVKRGAEYPHWRVLRNRGERTVYVVDCFQYTKIGYTATPVWSRMRGLQNGNPFDLHLVGVIPGDVAKERRFHAHFSKWLHRGEWFLFDDEARAELLAMIKRHKGKVFDPPIKFGTSS